MFHIICEGDNLPPPVTEFADARMPDSITRFLTSKNIKRPTPIQMQVSQSISCFLFLLWTHYPP